MFSSAILDVAIGLSFVFLLVSLLVTAAVETLSGLLKWRSTQLWEGLERLLQSKEARDTLYNHPLVKGLTRVNPTAPVWKQGKNGPSYIPSRTFALALLDLLRKPDQAAAGLEARLPLSPDLIAALRPLLQEAGNDIDRRRENIEIWFNDSMDRVSGWYKRRIAFHQAWLALALAMFMNVDALQITRTLWREPTLRQALVANAEATVRTPPQELDPSLTVVDEVRERGAEALPDEQRVRAQLSAVRLFPDGVARVTVTLPDAAGEGASLKATTSTPNVLLGSGSTEASHDSITLPLEANQRVAQFFVRGGPVNRASREQIVAEVVQPNATRTLDVAVLVTPPDRFATLQNEIGGLGLPIGWGCPTAKAAGGELDLSTTVGGGFWWSMPPGDSGRRWSSQSWWSRNQGVILPNLVMMVFGWLLTAAAASLGAPFWFDSLKRVTSSRSSGKAPEERPLGPKEVSLPREPGQRPREADLLDALKH